MSYSYNKNELFIYYKNIQKMSYSYIYIYKKRIYSYKEVIHEKKELFIYEKKFFIVIMIYKKVSCTKMLYNCYKK